MVIYKPANIKTISTIIANIETKIYCFGAGVMGKYFADFLCDSGISLNKFIFVDNSQKKIGNEVNVQGQMIQVISKTQMISDIKTDDIIIISSVTCWEIYNELQIEKKIENTKVFFSQIILLKSAQIGEKINFPNGGETFIPKTIHYCWFGKNKIPKEFQKNIDEWKEICPDYEIVEWNENNYNIGMNKYIQQAYEKKNWAFVSDYARLDIIYKYGGIYLDTDVQIINSMESLHLYRAFFSINASLKPNTGNGFGAQKEHKLVGKLRDYYNNLEFIDSQGIINTIPCTEHQYNIFKEFGFKANGRHQSFDDYTVLPFDVMCGYNHYVDKYYVNKNTITIHHTKRTWYDKKLRERAERSSKFLSEMI